MIASTWDLRPKQKLDPPKPQQTQPAQGQTASAGANASSAKSNPPLKTSPTISKAASDVKSAPATPKATPQVMGPATTTYTSKPESTTKSSPLTASNYTQSVNASTADTTKPEATPNGRTSIMNTAPKANDFTNAVQQTGRVIGGIAQGTVKAATSPVTFIESAVNRSNTNTATPNARTSIMNTPNTSIGIKAGEAKQAGSKANTAIEKWTNTWVPAPTSALAAFVAKASDALGEAVPSWGASVLTGGNALIGNVAGYSVGAANAFNTEMLEGSGDVGRSLVSGAVEFGAEALGGKLLNPIADKAPSGLLRWAANAEAEGLEENISGYANAVITGEPYTLQQALEENLIGFTVGGTMGAAQGASNAINAPFNATEARAAELAESTKPDLTLRPGIEDTAKARSGFDVLRGFPELTARTAEIQANINMAKQAQEDGFSLTPNRNGGNLGVSPGATIKADKGAPFATPEANIPSVSENQRFNNAPLSAAPSQSEQSKILSFPGIETAQTNVNLSPTPGATSNIRSQNGFDVIETNPNLNRRISDINQRIEFIRQSQEQGFELRPTSTGQNIGVSPDNAQGPTISELDPPSGIEYFEITPFEFPGGEVDNSLNISRIRMNSDNPQLPGRLRGELSAERLAATQDPTEATSETTPEVPREASEEITRPKLSILRGGPTATPASPQPTTENINEAAPSREPAKITQVRPTSNEPVQQDSTARELAPETDIRPGGERLPSRLRNPARSVDIDQELQRERGGNPPPAAEPKAEPKAPAKEAPVSEPTAKPNAIPATQEQTELTPNTGTQSEIDLTSNPAPQPIPRIVQAPEPLPLSESSPEPLPEPAPNPQPMPEPAPQTQPSPEPSPNPNPALNPETNLDPTPNPNLDLAPQPTPNPNFNPNPDIPLALNPNPLPNPDPAPTLGRADRDKYPRYDANLNIGGPASGLIYETDRYGRRD